MAVGIYDWALIVDHQRQQVSLLSYDDPQRRLQWLESQTCQPAEPFSLTSCWQSNMSRQQYGENSAGTGVPAQRRLLSGQPGAAFSGRYRGDEWQAFRKLNAANRAPFSAFIRLPEGAILSLSPERFIQLHQGDIQTRPIKGTLPRLDSRRKTHARRQRLPTRRKTAPKI